MKKLIAILTVMIVLVCSVFADIQTSLDLHIMLTAQVPSFRLSITSDTDVTSAAYLDSSNSGTSPSSALSSGSLETLLSSSGQVTVSFSLSQITNARLTGSHASRYLISVEATDLILQVNGADVENPDSFQKFSVVNESPDIYIASENLITTSNSEDFTVAEISSSDNELTVEYLGFVAASSNNPRSLGTFSVSWNANEDAIPGEYKAAIKLLISTP